MTLIVASKSFGEVSLSSDSRISFGNNGFIDFGVKIYSIPVKISSPNDFETNYSEIVYEKKLGLAVAGSLISAYTIKDSVSELLSNLQYWPGRTDVSMDGIAKLVFKFFSRTIESLRFILKKDVVTGIILSGYCPKESHIRSYKFSLELEEGIYMPKMVEVLENNQIIFMGSGEAAANEVVKYKNNLSPLHIIKEVIDKKSEKTVGGGLQYGDFDKNNDFRIFGVEDFSFNEDGSFHRYIHQLRGVELYENDLSMDEDDFHISYTFKRPFVKEIEEKNNQYYQKLGEDFNIQNCPTSSQEENT